MWTATVIAMLWGSAVDAITCGEFWSQPLVADSLKESTKLCMQGVIRERPDLLFDATCVEVICLSSTVKQVTPECFQVEVCIAECEKQSCGKAFNLLCDELQELDEVNGLWSTKPLQVILSALPPGMPSAHPTVVLDRHVNVSGHIKSLAAMPVSHINLSLLKSDDVSLKTIWCSLALLIMISLTALLLLVFKPKTQPGQEPLLG